jgi:hypothetical protein
LALILEETDATTFLIQKPSPEVMVFTSPGAFSTQPLALILEETYATTFLIQKPSPEVMVFTSPGAFSIQT